MKHGAWIPNIRRQRSSPGWTRARRLALGITMLAAGVLRSAATPASATGGAQEDPGLVYTVEIDGIIHPVSAEFLVSAIDRADAANATVFVLTLRTPGGLLESTRTITTRMIQAKTPIVVFVGPSGARAASAGFLITIAADIAAMAPGTHIGAAHPVSGTGEKVDETMAKKAASDVAADARTLAKNRGRNVQLAELAVTESRAFTEQEAIGASPPLIDLIAANRADLLAKLDGRTITRFNGESTVLRTKGARVETLEMTWRQRVLSAVAHPQVAYLLFSLGVLGLTIELWNPGAILPGVTGGLCLLLAFFAFQILPVNYAGLLLVLFGLALLVLELKVTSFGLLAAGGIASLLFGSLMIVDSPLPELQVGLQLILPVVLGLGGITMLLAKLAFDAQRRRSSTGSAGMIDEIGEVLTAIPAGGIGRVATHGEIWRALSSEPIAEGETVRVTAIDGLTLHVQRVIAPQRGPQP